MNDLRSFIFGVGDFCISWVGNMKFTCAFPVVVVLEFSHGASE